MPAMPTGSKPTLTVAENLEFWAAIYGTRGIAAALAG
jgi:ABC-type transport system involved in cytochrome c biogenesis ATPase subunit